VGDELDRVAPRESARNKARDRRSEGRRSWRSTPGWRSWPSTWPTNAGRKSRRKPS